MPKRSPSANARRRVAALLRQQAQLLDLANDPIIIWNFDERITYWNQGAVRAYGWPKAKARGQHIHTLLQTISPQPIAAIKAAFFQDGYWEGELSHTRRDGSRMTVASQWTLQRDRAGRPVATLEINQNITARKRMAEALQESEQRLRTLAQEQQQKLIVSDRLVSFGELAASLAHELNNPLGIVVGFAEALLAKLDPAHPHHQPLKIIAEEGRRCSNFVKDLMELARPSEMHLIPTDLAATVRKSVELITTHCQKLKVRPVVEIEPDLPHIPADSQQVEQILLNLFFNALEAMPEGGTLTVRIAKNTADQEGAPEGVCAPPPAVVVTITDTGTGIAAADLQQIFRPFFTTKAKKGMGLGLSICKSIIQAHGGRIEVDSSLGQGATFSLYFPVARTHT